jgi:hypothetical protein
VTELLLELERIPVVQPLDEDRANDRKQQAYRNPAAIV